LMSRAGSRDRPTPPASVAGGHGHASPRALEMGAAGHGIDADRCGAVRCPALVTAPMVPVSSFPALVAVGCLISRPPPPPLISSFFAAPTSKCLSSQRPWLPRPQWSRA
jgi:hypothetical protein